MLLSQFEGRFPTEESCVSYFRDIRIIQGVSCPNCGVKTDKWLQGRKIGKVVHYIKMFVIDNLSADTLDKIVHKHIDKDTVIVSDGSSSHINFEGYFKGYERHVESNVDSVVKTHLPWVHVVIGRCRSGIAAIHGEVDKQFLQLYLNEFCWKFNRRFFKDSCDPKYDLFDRLVKIAAIYTSDIKWRDYYLPDDEIV